MDWKDPDKEKFQARRTKGRVELDGSSGNALERDENLEERWEKSGAGAPKWVVALVAGGLLAGGVGLVVTSRSAVTPSEKNVGSGSAVEAVETKSFLEQASAEEIQDAVEAMVSGFMNANSNLERCKYVLGGDRLKETMDEFYSRFGSATQPQGFGKIQTAESAAFEGEMIVIALAVEQTGKKAWMYSLFSEGDGVKIDWETSVSYGEYSWPRFLREKPREKVQMRVYLKRLPAFKATRFLPNEADAYEVTAFGEKEFEVLYVPQGSEIGEALAGIVPEKVKHPVNLYLRWSEKDELEVVELIHNLWTASDRKKNE
ncbi:hypothetical protein N9A94_05860 [Akkermansiaceae bacterium]|nr:hypothetical protein [Akkermansiaceae bacterium]MDA7888755.1 hypothetical protein [Akkermansiaceae bacterium]